MGVELIVLRIYDIFFCKKKTAYEMRISDWSSDVCSSDLVVEMGDQAEHDAFAVVAGRGIRREQEIATHFAGRIGISEAKGDELPEQRAVALLRHAAKPKRGPVGEVDRAVAVKAGDRRRVG